MKLVSSVQSTVVSQGFVPSPSPSDINLAIVVANAFRWVIYRVERISFPVLRRLRTECCVRPIESGAVERLHMQGRVLMPQEVARIVSRLK
jgi:hypothetical protein